MTYTDKDIEKTNTGYSLPFTLPNGESKRINAQYKDGLAELVNDLIDMERQKMAAMEPYINGIKQLVDLILTQDGSGARAAAQVLLSAHNGYHYQIDLPDLCNLDNEYYLHALNVIHGRVKTMIEPHNLIDNGDDIFEELEKRWQYLNVRERYKKYY